METTGIIGVVLGCRPFCILKPLPLNWFCQCWNTHIFNISPLDPKPQTLSSSTKKVEGLVVKLVEETLK